VVLLLALVMGQSQAMKTAWIDDALALMPSLVFLVGDRISLWPPSQHFPFGFHRATTGAYLIASAALAAVGIYLLVDSVLTLIRQEHPEVGNIGLFGHEIWLGWLMIAALLYSGIPPIFLGRAKRPLWKPSMTRASMRQPRWTEPIGWSPARRSSAFSGSGSGSGGQMRPPRS
jgi:divalent metal cation (Fe/Co/Zn/Cd) transporter